MKLMFLKKRPTLAGKQPGAIYKAGEQSTHYGGEIKIVLRVNELLYYLMKISFKF